MPHCVMPAEKIRPVSQVPTNGECDGDYAGDDAAEDRKDRDDDDKEDGHKTKPRALMLQPGE
jgi:hypothetical protein